MNNGIKDLPVDLYRAEQVRELDRCAIEDHGISGFELMQRAGSAAHSVLTEMLEHKRDRRVLVVCGGGNNGGDGYVIALMARLAGQQVDLLALVGEDKLKGDALIAAQQWRNTFGSTMDLTGTDFNAYDAIVDAIVGTGLQHEVREPLNTVIDSINAAFCPVLAVDIPSGLSADTGQPLGAAVKADRTISFIGLKQGMFTGLAADYCGRIEYSDLDVPDQVFATVSSEVRRLQRADVQRVLPPRRRSAHKGEFGHALIVGGRDGMAGAAVMAGRAALRTGAGLVTLAIHPDYANVANVVQPELMSHAVNSAKQLDPLLKKSNVVAIGPGLGTSGHAQQLFAKTLDCEAMLVVDADALNLLAENQLTRGNWILTPHPGEAARLLKTDVKDVQADRFAAVRELAEHYRAVCVLKGAGTLVASAGDPNISLCDRGHPGMSSGGMGDVLTGVIIGILAQCHNAIDAAEAGVWLHAVAAEQAAVTGERGIVATDLLIPLQAQVNSDD